MSNYFSIANIKVVRRHKKNQYTPQAPKVIFNQYIELPEFVVIDENGENLGVLQREDALRIAEEKELDLILVSKLEGKGVAKIGDISKLKYEQSKKLKKNKSKGSVMKEWWFKPSIQDRDLSIKLEKVKSFLQKGGTAKITLRYTSKTPFTVMDETMRKIKALIEEFANPLSDVLREGRNLSITVKLKKNEKV